MRKSELYPCLASAQQNLDLARVFPSAHTDSASETVRKVAYIEDIVGVTEGVEHVRHELRRAGVDAAEHKRADTCSNWQFVSACARSRECSSPAVVLLRVLHNTDFAGHPDIGPSEP